MCISSYIQYVFMDMFLCLFLHVLILSVKEAYFLYIYDI